MKKLVQFFFSVQKLNLYDAYKMQSGPVIYFKIFGIVVKVVEVQPVNK